MNSVNIAILGAGAAGLFCAGSLAGSGKRVMVLDHAAKPGEKIRISGGGRCNFTNLATSYERFLSANPRFSASALAGYSPRDFVALIDRAGIAWHEKTLGQLFCDGSARQIVDLLLERMRGAELRLECGVRGLHHDGSAFVIDSTDGPIRADQVVVATGGRSIPKMGATGVGYEIAQSFGHALIKTRPGLVPLTFAEQDLNLCKPLAGVALPAQTSHGKGKAQTRFSDALLFTHRGLSGPSILQISSFWRPGEEVSVDLAPEADMAALLRGARGQLGRVQVATALGNWLPTRLADSVAAELGFATKRFADLSNRDFDQIAARINAWRLRPVGSEGWRTAEVTVGGVDTKGIDARSMESRLQPGLFFIGEVVDVTGWLGGYNFQWAWASAEAAAKAILRG